MKNIEPTNDASVSVPITIAAHVVEDLLISAFEGGSAYWATCTDFPVSGRGMTRTYNYAAVAAGLTPVTVCDREATDGPWTLNREAIERGVRLMAEKHPRHFGDLLAGNGDAVTGDVFLQLALMGEVVFA